MRRLLVLMVALPACAEGGPPATKALGLTVVNKCDAYPLQQLMMHGRIDDYGSAKNLLAAPLEPQAALTLTEPTIERGTWFCTVFRDKGPHQPPVAVTTATPIALEGGTYTLWVYEEGFYLLPPSQPSDGQIEDVGAGEPGPQPRLLDRGVDRAVPLDGAIETSLADRAILEGKPAQ